MQAIPIPETVDVYPYCVDVVSTVVAVPDGFAVGSGRDAEKTACSTRRTVALPLSQSYVPILIITKFIICGNKSITTDKSIH